MKTNEFRLSITKEERLIESQRMLDTHSHSLPLIIQSSSISITRKKYLVPCNMMTSQLIYFLRKKVELNPSDAMFMFVEEVNEDEFVIGSTVVASTSSSIEDLYASFRHSDGFMYCFIERENTFG